MAEQEIPPPSQFALTPGSGQSFLQLSAGYLDEYFDKIRWSVAQIPDEQVWQRTAQGVNSVGNLLLHLAGNLRMWLLLNLGEEPFVRDRDGEFQAEQTASGAQLVEELGAVVTRCRQLLQNLDATRLQEVYEIQGYKVDGLAVVYHAVEHMAYHTGQIVYLMKEFITDHQDVEFYPKHRGSC
jgi:uncharacterized damage-inducible protein DinB